MGAEAGLRSRIRGAIRSEFGRAHPLIVGQPANIFTGPGRPDLYVVVFGVYVGLEIKTPTGKATIYQLDRISQTRRAGGHAWLVRSPDRAVAALYYSIKHEVKLDMPDEFDFSDLFSTGGPAFKPSEIQAFLPSEPEVEAAVTRNGQVPAGDGVTVDPDNDYPLHQYLERTEATLKRVEELVMRLAEELLPERPQRAATSAEMAALLEEPESSTPPPTPAPKSRSRRRL